MSVQARGHGRRMQANNCTCCRAIPLACRVPPRRQAGRARQLLGGHLGQEGEADQPGPAHQPPLRREEQDVSAKPAQQPCPQLILWSAQQAGWQLHSFPIALHLL